MNTRSVRIWLRVLKVTTFCASTGVVSGVFLLGATVIPYVQNAWWEALRVTLYVLSWLPTVLFVVFWLLYLYGPTFVLSLAGVLVGVRIGTSGRAVLRWAVASCLCHLALLINTLVHDSISHGSVVRFAILLVYPHFR